MSKTYSFLDFLASFTGPGANISLGNGAGSAEEGVTVEFTEDAGKMAIGADGSVMHSLNASRAGKVTVRLQKTSPVNKQLTDAYNLQRISSVAWGRNIITMEDKARGDVYVCRDVAFLKHPTNTYGKDAGMLEWEFLAGQIDPALGSN